MLAVMRAYVMTQYKMLFGKLNRAEADTLVNGVAQQMMFGQMLELTLITSQILSVCVIHPV